VAKVRTKRLRRHGWGPGSRWWPAWETSELSRRLNAEGVDTQYVICDKEAPTGAALVLVNQEGEKQILTAPGANRRLTASDVRAAADFISISRVDTTGFQPVNFQCDAW
jgi:sugar/nucleoside kinase (ribokinase family)